MRRLILVGLLMYLVILLPATTAQDEQAAWEDMGIVSYHLATQAASAWNLLRVEVWVQDGNVQRLEARCEPGMVGLPCHVDSINPRDYLVEALFDSVDAAGDFLSRIEYDPTYHIPTLISYNNPNAIDEEYAIRVTTFEVLEEEDIMPDAFVTATALPETTPVQSISLSLNPVTPDGDLGGWIDDAEARWNAAGIDSYRLTLADTNPWNGMDITLEIEEGYVKTVDVTCHPGWMGGPCQVWTLDTQRYTVPGLFGQLRAAATMIGENTNMLEVDAQTGVPINMFYNDPDVFDEEWAIVVSQVVLLGDEAQTS